MFSLPTPAGRARSSSRLTRGAVAGLATVALIASVASAHAVRNYLDDLNSPFERLLPKHSPALPYDASRPSVRLAPEEKGIPASCAIAASGVKPDRTMLVHAMKGMSYRPYSFDAKAPFVPLAITFFNEKVEAKKATRNFLAIAPSGRLKRLSVVETFDDKGRVSSVVEEYDIGRGWAHTRELNSSKPYMYALDNTGKMLRYKVADDVASVSAAQTVGFRGFAQFTTLSTGQVFSLGKNSSGKVNYADSFIARTRSGGITQLLVSKATGKMSINHLQKKGWKGYTRVVTGQCFEGTGAPLLGITSSGQADAFYDADAGNAKGTDIASLGKVATGWIGRLGD